MSKTIFFRFGFIFPMGFFIFTSLYSQTAFYAVKLRCEYRENPIGIDNRIPALSWIMNDSRRAALQSAYQVIVAGSVAKAQNQQGDLWDSGKIVSGESVGIAYRGLGLAAGKKYFWRVRIWDASGRPSVWSEVSTFEMGLLSPTDWKADWIGRKEETKSAKSIEGNWIWSQQNVATGSMVYFRKSFTIASGKVLMKAWLKSSVDNCYEIRVNGNKITEIRQSYPWRGQRFFMQDITAALRPGDNQFTVAATQTRPEKQGGFIASLNLEFADGTSQTILSDDTWQGNLSDKPGWFPEMPLKGWGKCKIVEFYGGRNWGQILPAYQPPRSQMLRREFTAQKKIAQARLHVSGLGGYYVYLNGQPVSKDALAPGWTHYPKRIQYQTYDVTSLLRPGNNAVGALLGNLWWSGDVGFRGQGQYSEGPLRLILQIQITYEDGSSQTVSTDKSWKIRASPIIFNSLYDGECYDARLEIPGWNLPGLNDKDWQPVEIIPEKKNTLIAEQVQPIQPMQEIQPRYVTEIAPGKFIFDMGQNMSGWVRLKVQGPAGTKVTLRFAEILNPNGTLKTDPLRTARATDEYILSGKGTEIWEPRFTYHGFQFVEVTGFPGRPSREAIQGVVVHTNAPQHGQFTCSNDLLNKMQDCVNWTLKDNLHSVITDCPQRDERMGWTGDMQVSAVTASYNRDMTLMLWKSVRDMTDCQQEDGEVLSVNPNASNEGAAPAGWGDAIVILPWRVWQFTSDKRILEENYPAMVKWHKLKQKDTKNFLRETGGFGDWMAPTYTPGEMVSAAYYFYSTRLLSQIATILDKPEDAKNFSVIADKVAQAFNEKYYNRQTDSYGSNTQTANLLPLSFGITLPNAAELVAGNIASDVRKRDNHLTTGFLGTQYLLPALSRYGHHELAYQLATQWTYPSWGYMIDKGATTFWEIWDSDRQVADMNSRNHLAYGVIGEWFFRDLAGIEPDDKMPGFRHSFITVQSVGNLQWVASRLETVYGFISVQWEKKEQTLNIKLEIPPNTTSQVSLPARSVTAIQENGNPLSKISSLKNLKTRNGAVTFELGSGKYEFIIQL
jgi:alpha-L-rhamnosidase